MKYILNFKTFEKVSTQTLKDMRYFHVSKNDIDEDGYVTLYHGGKVLPEILRADEIFFMTPDYTLAEDYARIRKGEVFTLKVNPDDVNWNQGSQEVEFDKGGIIRDGVIIPKTINKEYSVKSAEDIKSSFYTYENVNINLFIWIERTLNYYLKNMTNNDALDKMIEDIEYFEYMDIDEKEYIEFAQDFKYDNIEDFHKDLRKISSLSFDEVYDEK